MQKIVHAMLCIHLTPQRLCQTSLPSGSAKSAGPIASLPQHLAAQLAAAKGGQLELVQQWQQQQQASQAYLQLLQQVLTSLTELVQDHLLGEQQVR